MLKYNIWVLLVICLGTVEGDNGKNAVAPRTKSDKYAASGAEMEKLMNMESQLLFQIERKIAELPTQTNPLTKIQVESLTNAIAKLEVERNLSKTLRIEASRGPGKARDEWKALVEKHLGNPVNQFRLIRRFHQNWDHVKILIESIFERLTVKHITELIDDYQILKEDLDEAANALTRLSNTYQIPIHKLAGEDESANQLELWEITRIAYHYKEESRWFDCALWYYSAISVKNETFDDEEHEFDLDLLQVAAFPCFKQANKENYAAALRNEIIERATYENFNEEFMKPEDLKLAETTTPSFDMEELPRPKLHSETLHYEALCREEVKQPELYCYYHTGSQDDFWLLLGPVRTEVLNENPKIVQFYEVIHDWEIEHIRSISQNVMERSQVLDKGGRAKSYERLSASKWLRDDQYPVIDNMSTRFSHVSGLAKESMEQFQIANYGIGGQYNPHYDYFIDEENMKNNRIATWLGYISEVQGGGGTAFPLLSLIVKPVKGSAVFWYNMVDVGEVDTRTKHGACPVLYGSKWISNKWFRSQGNEFKRLCPTVMYPDLLPDVDNRIPVKQRFNRKL